MIQGKKVLAIIPARGGSKEIKNKNILDICGKPLIAYTIGAAGSSIYIDDVVVSTDSEQIQKISEKYGAWVPFLRPAELAEDKTPTLDVVLHAVEALKTKGYVYDILILLQPTSPLRIASDIDGALKLFLEHRCRPLAAVSRVEDHPVLIRTVGADGYMQKLLPMQSTLRRQDMPVYYKINGSIYINLISEINKRTSFNDNPVPYIMPDERAVDIDHDVDIVTVQFYLNVYKEEIFHDI